MSHRLVWIALVVGCALGAGFTAWAAPKATASGTYCTAIPVEVTRNIEKIDGTLLPEGWKPVGGTSGGTLDGTGGRPLVIACATFP